MTIRKKTIYYDGETGIIQNEYDVGISELVVGFKVGSSKYGKSSRFSKVFQMEDPEFKTPTYYKYFYKCLLSLEMITNRLVGFTYEENLNKPLNEKDLTKIFGYSEKTTLRFIETCQEKDIIARIDKNGELYGYLINPLYALNGNKISLETFNKFKTDALVKSIKENRTKVILNQKYLGAGIYCLYNKNENIIYIGKSKDLDGRLSNHLSYHYGWRDEVYRIGIINFENLQDMDLYEIYLIGKHKPKYNKDCKRKSEMNYSLPTKKIDKIIDIKEGCM